MIENENIINDYLEKEKFYTRIFDYTVNAIQNNKPNNNTLNLLSSISNVYGETLDLFLYYIEFLKYDNSPSKLTDIKTKIEEQLSLLKALINLLLNRNHN